MSDEEKRDSQTTAVARQERQLEKAGFMFIPKTWEQLYAYAKEISATDFVPDSMRGKPGAVLAAWQKGQEVGLPPMAALQSIAIIKGRPAIHSAGYWGLITSHELCEDWSEVPPHDTVRLGYGECTIKRRGKKEPITRRFTIEQAQQAGLWGGTGDTKDKKEASVWFKYPGRMLQQRARHLAGEDAIPEASQGLLPSDIAMDLEPADAVDVTQKAEAPLTMPEAIKATDPIAEPKETPHDVHEETTSTAAAPEPEAQAPANANGAQDSSPTEKPAIEAVLEWIQTADKAVFKDTTALSAKLKGLSNKDQITACRAWNERSRQAK